MTIAFAPTSKPLPPVRAITAAATSAYNASSSYTPCSSSFSNRSQIRLRNERKSSPLLIKCGGGGAVQEIDESQFADVVLKSTCPVLVEFVATWCGPCRLVAPAVQSLAKVSWNNSSELSSQIMHLWFFCWLKFPKYLISHNSTSDFTVWCLL